MLRDASYWAYTQVQVAAAGNSGGGDPSINNVAYPARYSWVIAVGALDSDYTVPTWSSDGVEVDVAAPGVNILSTYPSGRSYVWHFYGGASRLWSGGYDTGELQAA